MSLRDRACFWLNIPWKRLDTLNERIMKTHKEDKHRQKENHKVETPSPPQVMDPSSPPDKQQGDKTKHKGKQNSKTEQPDKKKQPSPLAPREEL
jgi:hypothetical protein